MSECNVISQLCGGKAYNLYHLYLNQIEIAPFSVILTTALYLFFKENSLDIQQVETLLNKCHSINFNEKKDKQKQWIPNNEITEYETELKQMVQILEHGKMPEIITKQVQEFIRAFPKGILFFLLLV